MVSIGLDEAKNNLVELEEIYKEGLSNLELKLNEAISSLQRENDSLKRQVDEAAEMGLASLVTMHETRIEAPKPKEIRGESSAQDVENFLWQMDAYFEHVNMQNEDAKIRTTTMYLTYTAMLW